MYTRAKKIGRKVMAGGENRMMQPAAPVVVKWFRSTGLWRT